MTIDSLVHILKGKCPACNSGTIFIHGLDVRDRCACCGFELRGHDAADGPAFFVMSIVGTLVALVAVLVDVLFGWPMWLHVVVWSVVSVAGSVIMLRWFKAWLIRQQYKHNVDHFRDDK